MADDSITSTIREWGTEFGFQHIGITDIDIEAHADRLSEWLGKQYHGEMGYMEGREGLRREPETLVPNAIRVISARMDYLPDNPQMQQVLDSPEQAYISRYALGRDYHKLIRKRLAQFAQKIEAEFGGEYRAFVDSAPVLERGFAEKAGLGWIGKNTMLINEKAGSWFFLGEIFTDLPLEIDPPQQTKHCGSCTACIQDCPTGAIVAPFEVDARKCVSYLTIELRSSIPVELRPLMGNRVFGCDDCQLVCPWNKFAEPTKEIDFSPRNKLDNSQLVDLFAWSEEAFLKNTAGSPIRRIGYECWLRNLAVGLGNAPSSDAVLNALQAKREHSSALVREHVSWALNQHSQRTASH
jgi:epoxyqueuosine reductase